MATMDALQRQFIDNYADAQNALDREVVDALRNALYSLDPDDPNILQIVMELMDEICDIGALQAETMANIFYDGIRQIQAPNAKPYSAEAFGTRKRTATYTAVAGIMKDGLTQAAIEQLTRRAAYEMKRAASENMVANAYADPSKPAFARIPSATCKCDFCLMLGSRGFVYHSELTAGGGLWHGSNFDHYHAFCKCEVVCVFDDNPRIDGYDPGKLYGEWVTMVDEMAKERAEQNGTTADYEYRLIMQKYGEAAASAQAKNGKSRNDPKSPYN